jgi:pimeloyl-ACP methyl ester carboxylesterase
MVDVQGRPTNTETPPMHAPTMQTQACVVGHSYGTLVASRLVKRFPERLHSLCLVDPVCFGMYMPHLLHNFFYRTLVFNWAK